MPSFACFGRMFWRTLHTIKLLNQVFTQAERTGTPVLGRTSFSNF